MARLCSREFLPTVGSHARFDRTARAQGSWRKVKKPLQCVLEMPVLGDIKDPRSLEPLDRKKRQSI